MRGIACGTCLRLRLLPALLGTLCLAGAAGPALAQRTTFIPALFGDVIYTDNVRFVDEGTADASDTLARLGAALDVTRPTKNGVSRFEYRGAFTKHDRFAALDHDAHRVSVNTTVERAVSNISATASWTRSQDQGGLEQVQDQDFFLVSRTTRETLRGRLVYGRRLAGGPWRWETSVGGSRSGYHRIRDFGTPAATTQVEERKSFDGVLGFDRTLSRRASAGVRYRGRRTLLQRNPDETVHAVSGVFDHLASRATSFQAELGLFLRREDATAGRTGGSETGLLVGLDLRRRTRGADIGLNASRRSSAGGALTGTSTNTVTELYAGDPGAPRLGWRASVRFARREPTATVDPTVDNRTISAGIDWRASRLLAARLQAAHVEQTSNDPNASVGSFYRVGLGMVWHPLGRDPNLEN